MDGLEADGSARFCFALVCAPHGRRGSSHQTLAQSSVPEIKSSLTPTDQKWPDYLEKCLIMRIEMCFQSDMIAPLLGQEIPLFSPETSTGNVANPIKLCHVFTQGCVSSLHHPNSIHQTGIKSN